MWDSGERGYGSLDDDPSRRSVTPDFGMWGQRSQQSTSLDHSSSQSYFDGRRGSVPVRWHPEYSVTGNTSGLLPVSSSKLRFGVHSNVSSFLSSIPEHSSTLHYPEHHNNAPVNHTGDWGTLDASRLSDMELGSRPNMNRRHSANDLPPTQSSGKYVKKGGRGPRRTSKPDLYPTDDSHSLSSEGYGSTRTRRESGSQMLAHHRTDRRGSVELLADSENSETSSSAGRNINGGKNGFPLSNLHQRPSAQADLRKPSFKTDRPRNSSRDDWRRSFSKTTLQTQSFTQRRSSEPAVKIHEFPPQSKRQFSSSSNTLKLPGQDAVHKRDQEPPSPYSGRQNETSFNVTRSEAGKSSLTESRRQSIFNLGGSGISAQMVANNPSAAANMAFASMELPPELLPTLPKQLRQLCSPVITCFLVMTLAASLGAAIYFAVVLNKTQTEQIEYLRATLRFHLNQTSQDTLTSMSTSQRTEFEKEYCAEITDYYRRSSLSDTYRGCQVASVQGGELSVVLYFDKPPTNETKNPGRREDVILSVLASSAPRVGQEESDVISINNIPVELSTVNIHVDQTAKVPSFARPLPHDVSSQTVASSTVSLNTSSSDAIPRRPPKPTKPTTLKKTDPPTTPREDRLHPCAPGESRTYYRYPGSCSIFVHCLSGRSITISCGSDLVFDIDRKVCVKEVTNCDAQQEETEFFGDVNPEDLKPCEYRGGSYHPHPRICNLYIQCSLAGTSVVQTCPHRLVFSTQSQTCVLLDKDFQCPQPSTNQSTGNSTDPDFGRAKDTVRVAKSMDVNLNTVEIADNGPASEAVSPAVEKSLKSQVAN